VDAALSRWAPLVEGETAARALEAVEAIAHDLAGTATVEGSGLDLNQGRSGAALFLAYLQRARGDAAAGARAELLLDQAIAALAATPAPAAGLYNGFTGLAWVVEHLTEEESAADAGGEAAAAGGADRNDPDELDGEEGEDLNAGIDTALLALLRREPWRGEFDLLGGLVGFGIYALERLPRPSAAALLPLVVARLAERAERGPRGVAWHRRELAERQPDPGMAHGAAGVIAVLARMLQEGAATPEAAALLEAAVEGVLDLVRTDEGRDGELAWCAGNAGLSVALLAAGRAAGREDWERASLGLAGAAARRRFGAEESFDPALCHGTAGLSHLFHRLYRATGDSELRAAAVGWLERTLARRRPGAGVGGFLFRRRQPDGDAGWVADPGFLGGSAGIGLALLAAATPVEPAWDRLLLLSGRGGC